jgi:hypothetical protein
MAPIPIAPVVRVGIHDARPGNHDRGLLYNYGRWRHDYGLWSNHDRRWGGDDGNWQRQPKSNGDMHPSRVCRERQGKAGDGDKGHNA